MGHRQEHVKSTSNGLGFDPNSGMCLMTWPIMRHCMLMCCFVSLAAMRCCVSFPLPTCRVDSPSGSDDCFKANLQARTVLPHSSVQASGQAKRPSSPDLYTPGGKVKQGQEAPHAFTAKSLASDPLPQTGGVSTGITLQLQMRRFVSSSLSRQWPCPRRWTAARRHLDVFNNGLVDVEAWDDAGRSMPAKWGLQPVGKHPGDEHANFGHMPLAVEGDPSPPDLQE